MIANLSVYSRICHIFNSGIMRRQFSLSGSFKAFLYSIGTLLLTAVLRNNRNVWSLTFSAIHIPLFKRISNLVIGNSIENIPLKIIENFKEWKWTLYCLIILITYKVLCGRVEICRDRHDWRSCKICASCVKFPGKTRFHA